MLATHQQQAQPTRKGNAPKAPFFQAGIKQPKLNVNTPGDAFEQQADAMADKVMRMPTSQSFFRSATIHVHRKCQHCDDEKKMLHRKENTSAETKDGANLDNYVSSLGSSGQPMSATSRQFFEPRFGRDFSNVRIHNDGVAAKSAQSINALAYTTGNNIVFNQGQYAPNSEPGQRLMAHELTHVVQQGGAKNIQRKDDKPSAPKNPGVQELCLPMSAWMAAIGVPAPWLTSAAFGFLIEKLIEADYCASVGCNYANIYFDDLSPSRYVDFLVSKNPQLAAHRDALWLVALTGLNRPDILVHQPPTQEFYEIKPRSVSGLTAGIAKLETLLAFYDVYKLPYTYGTTYAPADKKIKSATVNAGPWPVTVSIRVDLVASGLIAYDICVEGELAKIASVALVLAILAALAILQPELDPILVPAIQAIRTAAALAGAAGGTQLIPGAN